MEWKPLEGRAPLSRSREVQDRLLQWGLSDSLRVHRFQFRGAYRASDPEPFLRSFFQSSLARETIGSEGSPDGKRLSECGELSEVRFRPLGTGVQSMSFFDPLLASGVVSEDGTIRSCYEESYHGVLCQDRLRELFLNEEGENRLLFSESQRDELLFQLLEFLVVGGSLCQPSYLLGDYLETAKALYKDLVRVHRDPKTGEISSAVSAFRVENALYSHGALFPADEFNQRCIVVVDPPKRSITLFYSPFFPYF